MQELSSLSSKKGKGGKIKIKSHAVLTAGLVFLALPVLIFVLGWFRLYIAVPAALLLAGTCVLAVREWRKDTTEVEFDILFLIILAVFSVVICLVSDIGEYMWGTTDHAYRRAVLRDLTDYRWPVIYDLANQTDPVSSSYLGTGRVAFSYYVTYWMVPSLAGKVAGFEAGNFILLLYSAAGIFLTVITSCFFLRKQSYALLFTLTFFSGLDFIPYMVYGAIGTEDWMWLEGYTRHISMISNINNLMNVFNQCIPCWLIVAMLLVQKEKKNIGLTASLMFAFSPWATIGMIPLAIWALLKDKPKIKALLSICNIIPPLLILAVYAPSYTANSRAVSVSGPTWSFYDSFGSFAVGYLMIAAVEILPFALILWKRFHKMSLFFVTFGSLLLIPLYKVSSQNDFTMRGTMPALFVVSVLLAGAINGYISENRKKKNRGSGDLIRLLGYLLLMLVMSLVAFQMILVTLVSSFDGTERPDEYIGSFGDINNGFEVDVIDEQFFVRDYENTLFYGHLAWR